VGPGMGDTVREEYKSGLRYKIKRLQVRMKGWSCPVLLAYGVQADHGQSDA
jgi:hypothetical protein